MAMLEKFASLEEKILCLNYPISKLDGVYINPKDRDFFEDKKLCESSFQFQLFY